MSATDPTGNFSLRQALAVVVAVVAVVLQQYWALKGIAAFGLATAAGFVSGAIATGTLKGALWGAVSAAAFFGIGSYFQNVAGGNLTASAEAVQNGGKALNLMKSGLTTGQTLAKIAAHAGAGGTLNVLQGGKFGHGFVAAGFTEALSPAVGQWGEANDISTILARTATSAAIGGTASVLSGGAFANGAKTGAFQQLFNEIAHQRMIDATRDVETMHSVDGEVFNDFVKRLGSRVYDLTQENNVEYASAIGARLEFMNGQQVDRFGAIIQTQNAATWSIATKVPVGFKQVFYKGRGMTIHAHPVRGRVTRSDRLFSGGEGSRIRIGGRAPGDPRNVSDVDRRAGAGFLATPTGVVIFDQTSSRAF